MAIGFGASIGVIVELGGPLRVLAGTAEARVLEQRLGVHLGIVVGGLGLVGDPAVSVRATEHDRVVRVWVNGVRQRYSPGLMWSAWLAVAPAHLHHALDATALADQVGFPDGWLAAYVAGLDPGQDEPGRTVVFDFLARLVADVIEERPGHLVDPTQAPLYLENGTISSGEVASPIGADSLCDVLRSLLDLGVSVNDRSLVLSAIRTGLARGRPSADWTEAAFARLRANRIEIHAHPAYLRGLGVPVPAVPSPPPMSVYDPEIDEEFRHLFRSLEDNLFLQLGLPLPALVWVVSRGMRERMLAVKINDRLGPPVLGLELGTLLVNAPTEQVRRMQLARRPGSAPMGGGDFAVVSELDRRTIQQAGLASLGPREFVLQVLALEIIQVADRLLSTDDVEYLLARLKREFPDLVRATLVRFTVEDLTRVLRGLLRERLAIRDLPTILGRLLEYDTIPVDAGDAGVLDDGLPVENPASSDAVAAWESYLAFVRAGLQSQIGHACSRGTGKLSVYPIDTALEDLLAKQRPCDPCVGGEILEEADQDRILEAAWAKLGGLPAGSLESAILCSFAVRSRLRDIIAAEMPAVPVLCLQELSPDLDTNFRARISLST
jgi:type III secretion protein V